LTDTWELFVVQPRAYARAGFVDEGREDGLAEDILLAMAKAYSLGLVDEMAWLLAHAIQHAWHANRLYGAAMFGSFLDKGDFCGKLDRIES
jgi:hypothetical protein